MNDTKPKKINTIELQARSECECYLQKQKEYNVENNILASENIIIDRLLYRGVELSRFYNEIYNNLETEHWKRVISAVLYTGAMWNCESAKKARDAKKRLEDNNKESANLLIKLASLLEERDMLSNNYGFSSYEKYHIVDVIDEASNSNGCYSSFLRKPLQSLANQFDFKYWPTIAEIIKVIAKDAKTAKIDIINPITEEHISAYRNGYSDFFNAFMQALKKEKESISTEIPERFGLSDDLIASVGNCALDLRDENLRDAAFVKSVRQRSRTRQ